MPNALGDSLEFLDRLYNVFEARYMGMLRRDHNLALMDPWCSLRIFLNTYAFNRQGAAPDYAPVALDVLAEAESNGMVFSDSNLPATVWRGFEQRLSGGSNVQNSALCPSGTSYTIEMKSGKVTRTANSLSAIEFTQSLWGPQSQTLCRWACEQLISNHINEAFQALLLINGIGPKIASLFLQDMVLVYDLNLMGASDRYLLQPIDVWARRVIHHLAGKPKLEDQACAVWITAQALHHGASPERVSHAIWFLGAKLAGSDYRLAGWLKNGDLDIQAVTAAVVDYLDSAARTGSERPNWP